MCGAITDPECQNVKINYTCTNLGTKVSSLVVGGTIPYVKYTWYKQVNPSTGQGIIAFEQSCSQVGCNDSYTYNFTSADNVSLRVEDKNGIPMASNILSVNCVNGGNSSHCGINPDGSMFCGTGVLGLVGTGTICSSVSACGVCKKR